MSDNDDKDIYHKTTALGSNTALFVLVFVFKTCPILFETSDNFECSTILDQDFTQTLDPLHDGTSTYMGQFLQDGENEQKLAFF